MTRTLPAPLTRAALLAATILTGATPALAVNTAIDGNNGTLPLPTGQYVTPLAAPGATQQFLSPGLDPAINPNYANFVAAEASRAELSADGVTLAIVTAGANYVNDTTGATDIANSTQYIFLYDVAGANKATPKLVQVIKQGNAHVGLAWGGNNTLYVAGGADDRVYVYTKSGSQFVQTAAIDLGHGNTGSYGAGGTGKGVGLSVEPNAAGLAVSADGKTLVVANQYNDSISVIDTATNTVRYEQDLRPFANEGTAGVAGGEYPTFVAIKGNNTAYVGSYRDRQVVVVDISGAAKNTAVTRIALDGNAAGMTLSHDSAQSTLYVAQDNADQVAVINTATNTVAAKIDARAPAGVVAANTTGAATFSARISPDGTTLYAVNNGSNTVAIVPLTGPNANTVTGLIPTAYAPKDVAFSADGSQIFIINGKSDTGPNPMNYYGFGGNTSALTQTTYPGGNVAADAAGQASNQYQFQLERSTLVSMPVPTGSALALTTAQAERNNFYTTAPVPADATTMAFLRNHIQHIIYIVKENRTYDQVLGDLNNGSNGNPGLTIFGKRVTPNQHQIASKFVTLDNFFSAGDGSMDGWSLATQGRLTVNQELNQALNYANVDRGVSYDTEGSNRNVPVLATAAARAQAFDSAYGAGAYNFLSSKLPGGTANLLPGLNNHTATDAPFGRQLGYIYDAVIASGGTVRNYGFLVQNTANIANAANPGGFVKAGPDGANVQQAFPLDPSLLDKTDVYFRGYDQKVPDLWRFNEWNREFQAYVANSRLPSLELLRLSHDHTGNFSTAQGGVNTPETMVADNDLAVGKVLQAVANSPYAATTLIIITEDDCQDGPDHVDSHRATAYAAGAFVKQHAIVSTRYNQVSVLRTIEDILGTPHINLNTAYQRPMTEIFDTTGNGGWSFTATASSLLKSTQLSLAFADNGIQYADSGTLLPTHDAAYWANATKGFDFSAEDRVPPALFNEVLWAGLMDGVPYPAPAGSVANKD